MLEGVSGLGALGIVIDSETLRLYLTETADTSGVFRSGPIVLTDTVYPISNDGSVSWGRGDTLIATYTDNNDASDSTYDTALALEIATGARVFFYEDTARSEERRVGKESRS